MAIDTRGIKQSSAFNLRTALPLDLRTVRTTIAERDDIPLQYRYDGMPCYVVADQTIYVLKGGITNPYWVGDCCKKYNLDAIIAPTITNNASEGYSEGSFWVDNADGSVYLLINFEPNGNATWLQISGEFNWTNTNW